MGKNNQNKIYCFTISFLLSRDLISIQLGKSAYFIKLQLSLKMITFSHFKKLYCQFLVMRDSYPFGAVCPIDIEEGTIDF